MTDDDKVGTVRVHLNYTAVKETDEPGCSWHVTATDRLGEYWYVRPDAVAHWRRLEEGVAA